jgi:hypothetical protein
MRNPHRRYGYQRVLACSVRSVSFDEINVAKIIKSTLGLEVDDRRQLRCARSLRRKKNDLGCNAAEDCYRRNYLCYVSVGRRSISRCDVRQSESRVGEYTVRAMPIAGECLRAGISSRGGC